jgi:hypothetical protein
MTNHALSGMLCRCTMQHISCTGIDRSVCTIHGLATRSAIDCTRRNCRLHTLVNHSLPHPSPPHIPPRSLAVSMAKQLVPNVPSSNAPPIPEWAGKYWYMLRTAALQARPTLTADEISQLVGFFASLNIVTPCEKCRGHYHADWQSDPFTASHAIDPARALDWVNALERKVADRVAAERAAEAANPTPAAPAAAAVAPARTVAAPVTRLRAATIAPPHLQLRGPVAPAPGARPFPGRIGTLRASTAPQTISALRATRAAGLSVPAMSTLGSVQSANALAAASALRATAVNRSGGRSCNCGGRRR